MAVSGQYQSKEANTYGKIHDRRPLVFLSHFEICKSNLISLCLYHYDSLLNLLKLFWFNMTCNKHHLTVIQTWLGFREGLNLGSIPNVHMPSQKGPKISIERRCSTILQNGLGMQFENIFEDS